MRELYEKIKKGTDRRASLIALKKELKETCLMDQTFVMDGDLSVQQYVDKCAKEIGKEIKVKAFVRYEVGEGIEKKVDDLAAEVAKMTQA